MSSSYLQDLNPSYYIRKPAKKQFLDETIYFKRDEPFERPVEFVNRPFVRDTIFLPDRQPPPIIPPREVYRVSPEPPKTIYTTTTTTTTSPISRFSLLPALGLNADCPCWSWICIILGFITLLGLIGLCLYYILEREGHI